MAQVQTTQVSFKWLTPLWEADTWDEGQRKGWAPQWLWRLLTLALTNPEPGVAPCRHHG